MKSKSFLFWSVLAFISAAVIHASGEEVQPYAIPGRYIVVLKHGHHAAEVMAKHGVKARHVFSHALHGFAGEIPADQLEALRQDPRIELIEPELELFATAQTLSTGVKGIDFVTQNAGQIEVANLSFGGIGYSSALRLAINNSVAKGVVFVVAAGNDSRDVYGPDGLQNTADDSIPAAYPEVMTVSALYDLDGVPSSDDTLASFSNYSRNVVAGNPVTSPGAAIDLAAPGVNIVSTYLSGGYAP